jgi:hypothetical protein
MGTSKLIDSSAAFLFEVSGSNSPLVVQELQIGGTSVATPTFLTVLRRHLSKERQNQRKPIFASGPLILTFAKVPAGPDANVGIGPLACRRAESSVDIVRRFRVDRLVSFP